MCAHATPGQAVSTSSTRDSRSAADWRTKRLQAIRATQCRHIATSACTANSGAQLLRSRTCVWQPGGLAAAVVDEEHESERDAPGRVYRCQPGYFTTKEAHGKQSLLL